MNIYISKQNDMKIMNMYLMINWSNCRAYVTQYSNTDILVRPN